MAFFEWLIHETGIYSLYCSGNRDVYLILITRFLRMFAYGGAALVLAIFLYTTGNKGQQIGTFMSLTLLGDAAISYALTLVADRVGRRRVLLIGSLLMVLAGTVFAFSKNYYVLLVAAIIGVISPGAHEIGPFRAVEVKLSHPPVIVISVLTYKSFLGICRRASHHHRRANGYLCLVCGGIHARNVGRSVYRWLDHLFITNPLQLGVENDIPRHLRHLRHHRVNQGLSNTFTHPGLRDWLPAGTSILRGNPRRHPGNDRTDHAAKHSLFPSSEFNRKKAHSHRPTTSHPQRHSAHPYLSTEPIHPVPSLLLIRHKLLCRRHATRNSNVLVCQLEIPVVPHTSHRLCHGGRLVDILNLEPPLS